MDTHWLMATHWFHLSHIITCQNIVSHILRITLKYYTSWSVIPVVWNTPGLHIHCLGCISLLLSSTLHNANTCDFKICQEVARNFIYSLIERCHILIKHFTDVLQWNKSNCLQLLYYHWIVRICSLPAGKSFILDFFATCIAQSGIGNHLYDWIVPLDRIYCRSFKVYHYRYRVKISPIVFRNVHTE